MDIFGKKKANLLVSSPCYPWLIISISWLQPDFSDSKKLPRESCHYAINDEGDNLLMINDKEQAEVMEPTVSKPEGKISPFYWGYYQIKHKFSYSVFDEKDLFCGNCKCWKYSQLSVRWTPSGLAPTVSFREVVLFTIDSLLLLKGKQFIHILNCTNMS